MRANDRNHIVYFVDQCEAGYRYLDGKCALYRPTCQVRANAGADCTAQGAHLSSPEDERESYWLSYVSGQVSISLAKTDSSQEGVWVNAYGKLSLFTKYFLRSSFKLPKYKVLDMKSFYIYFERPWFYKQGYLNLSK